MNHEQHYRAEWLRLQTRRQFLSRSAAGLGTTWLAGQLAASEGSEPVDPGDSPANGGLHFPAKAKRVIFLHMIGAPSQLELFDYKPELVRFDGKECPQEYLEGQRFAFIQGTPQMLGPQFPFKQHGESGAWVSDRLPHFSKLVDKVCFIKTMQTDQFNHGPAQLMVHCGQPRIGYPSAGSWVTWGLGTENEDLPGFIVLLSGGRQPRVGNALWGGGFLPSVYQGVQCRSKGDPVLNVSNPNGVSRDVRRKAIDALADLNQMNHQEFGDPETLTRIAQYELAFKMQMTVPEAMDISDEPKTIHEEYGTEPGKESFANNCLLARRLVERGVRFVQLFDWGWDSHGSQESESLNAGFKRKCEAADRPMAALLTDLERRGLLEDTLVVWGGEFGRTSMAENRGGIATRFVGRDHNPNAFTFWMAGAGVKPGMSYGETDPMGYMPAENPVQLRDFHATLQHLLGIDHHKMTAPFQGLNQKLTGVKPARVIEEILA
ncbi:MAG TPA: sulfatase [Planctomycetaceae bacterium]|nr:sulfatase [Planctomycetaceae bacterium]